MLCALAKNQVEEALKALLPDNKGIDNTLWLMCCLCTNFQPALEQNIK